MHPTTYSMWATRIALTGRLLLFYLRMHGKNGFVTATKLGTTNELFVASTKNFATATKRFVYRTKHFVVTKYFCYPYFNIWLCWYNETFFPCVLPQLHCSLSAKDVKFTIRASFSWQFMSANIINTHTKKQLCHSNKYLRHWQPRCVPVQTTFVEIIIFCRLYYSLVTITIFLVTMLPNKKCLKILILTIIFPRVWIFIRGRL